MEVRKYVAEEWKEKFMTGGGAYVADDKSIEKNCYYQIINSKIAYCMKKYFDSKNDIVSMIEDNDIVDVYANMDEFEVVPNKDALTSSGTKRRLDTQELSFVNCGYKANTSRAPK